MVHEVYHPLMRRIFATAVCAALLLGCHFDRSLTAEPTRNIDERLTGTWTPVDPTEKNAIVVRAYDDRNYVLAFGSDEIYRAFHSDAAGMPILSVQNLNDSERKWVFITWSLSQDGKTLTLRSLSTELIPNTDRAAMIKAIEANRENPKLLGEPGVYRR